MTSTGPPYVLMTAVLGSAAGLWFGLRTESVPSLPSLPAAVPTVSVDASDYTRRQPGRVLVGGFSSYSSVSSLQQALAAKQFVPETRSLGAPADATHPPHELQTLSVDHYPLMGLQGRLSLQFFNDRLFEIGYRPDDAVGCSAALKRSEPQLHRDANGRAEHTEGSRRVATNVDLAASSVGRSLNTEPYVLWQDLRLVRERDDWDRRFGSLAYRSD